MIFQTTRFEIPLDAPRVMGIVNVTPDSFSDGGRHLDPSAALAHCERLIEEGADLLDIGGESSRPQSQPISATEEIDRIASVIEGAVRLGRPISVDTTKPEVMQAALALGADIVNDIGALQAPGALDVVARHPRCGVCLMHMRGTPQTMTRHAVYQDVVEEVAAFLRERVEAVRAAGVDAERIAIDPGIGFAKTAEHNVELLRRQDELLAVGRPLLVGWSRKSTLGQLTGRPVEARLAASLAAALAAVQKGASIVRVHDVAATVDALRIWAAAGLATGR